MQEVVGSQGGSQGGREGGREGEGQVGEASTSMSTLLHDVFAGKSTLHFLFYSILFYLFVKTNDCPLKSADCFDLFLSNYAIIA